MKFTVNKASNSNWEDVWDINTIEELMGKVAEHGSLVLNCPEPYLRNITIYDDYLE